MTSSGVPLRRIIATALLALGVFAVWAITLIFTLYMAIFQVPLSLLQSLGLIAMGPPKFGLRTVAGGLTLWFAVMTLNQCIGLGWLVGYELIKDRAYATSSGDLVSALYFASSTVASTAVIYTLRHELRRFLLL